MNFTRQFRVDPGSSLDFGALDLGFHDEHKSEAEVNVMLRDNLAIMSKLQRELYAGRRHSILIVPQGIDGAGKDGICWHVISGMDPQGVQVTGFKQPSPEERDHDFLWRAHSRAPARGRVAIFNRSHYEDVLVARVHRLVSEEILEPRYDFINDWEWLLSVENETTTLKFFLLISKEEQLARFKERLDDPAHQWKISAGDYTERQYWDDYIRAFETALTRCSTDWAPWFVIPSNQKWFRDLAVSQIIVDALQGMKLGLPKPGVDIEEIRRLYHQEEVADALPDVAKCH
jgi:PPK2 family polyphosphate:nucleotide phosphotransferase